MKILLSLILIISSISFAGNKKNHKNKTTVKHKNGKTIIKNVKKKGDKKTIKKLVINHKKRKIKFIKKKNILDGNPLNSPVKEKYARFEIILPEKLELDKAFYKIKGQKREKVELTKLEDMKYEAKISVSHLAPGEYDIKFTVFDEKAHKNKKHRWFKKFKRYKAAFSWFGFVIDDSLVVPDPGEEGRKTLLGIDTNSNGVRDDIERYIHEKGFTPEQEKAMLDHAEILSRSQRVACIDNNTQESIKAHTEMFNHAQCLIDKFVPVKSRNSLKEFFKIRDELYLINVNTPSRIECGGVIGENYSGQRFTIPDVDTWSSFCK